MIENLFPRTCGTLKLSGSNFSFFFFSLFRSPVTMYEQLMVIQATSKFYLLLFSDYFGTKQILSLVMCSLFIYFFPFSIFKGYLYASELNCTTA